MKVVYFLSFLVLILSDKCGYFSHNLPLHLLHQSGPLVTEKLVVILQEVLSFTTANSALFEQQPRRWNTAFPWWLWYVLLTCIVISAIVLQYKRKRRFVLPTHGIKFG